MDSIPPLPDDFIQLCRSVTAKRPKAVIDHILQYGFITTEDLKKQYNYSHPPRAARDVREHGIPLETFRVADSDGKRIAAYRFGDISKARFSRLAGRTGLSKQLKDDLGAMAASALSISKQSIAVNYRSIIGYHLRLMESRN
jgi:hypothetical protein